MKKKLLACIILVLLFFTSCGKSSPTTVETLPVSEEQLDYYEMPGRYVSEKTNDECAISIYSDESEDSEVGNIEVTFDNKTFNATLFEVSKNVLQFTFDDGTIYWLAFNYDSDTQSFTLYKDGKETDTFTITKHFYS